MLFVLGMGAGAILMAVAIGMRDEFKSWWPDVKKSVRRREPGEFLMVLFGPLIMLINISLMVATLIGGVVFGAIWLLGLVGIV